MQRKIITFLAILLTVCLAACGSSSTPAGNVAEVPVSSENGTSTAQMEEAPEGTPEENAMADGMISKYLDDGKMNIGIDGTFPPLMYMNNDEPDGPGVELIREIGRRLNAEVEIIKLKNEELLDAVGNKADVSFVSLAVLEDVTGTVSVTEPCYETAQAVLLPADSDIEAREDLFGRIIGCLSDTESELFIDDLGAEDGTTEKRLYDNAEEAVEDLLNGELDALIVRQSTAQKCFEAHQGEISMTEGSSFGIEDEGYVFVIPQEDTILMEQLNTVINEMKTDGTLEKLITAVP